MKSNFLYHLINALLCSRITVLPITVVLVLALLGPVTAAGQQQLHTTRSYAAYNVLNDTTYNDNDTTVSGWAEEDPAFDLVTLTMNVVRLGSFEIEALVFDEMAYLPLHQLFDFLKVKNNLSEGVDSVAGFFINPGATYLIDKSKHRIFFQGKTYRLKPTDLLRTETDLYLKIEYFGKVFGLDCSFDFRSLSVSLNTKLELPIIREMHQAAMRTNLERLKGERKADTTIGRKFSMLQLGMADWSVMATQDINGKSSARLRLDMGAVVAGGELNAYLNYNSNQPFGMDQQFFRWRYVNNNNPLLRQVIAGRIAPQPIASVFRPVTGVQFTNTPTLNRKSFGSYTLSNKTEPGWTVELYLNDVLVEYTKADASGFYSFEVPMVYGNTMVKLRFFGPWGEEKTEQQYLSIPFNFVPLHQLEYTVSAGIVDDGESSRFSKVAFNYGLSKQVSIGAGHEYLSSVMGGGHIPFVNASVRVSSNLLATGEHSYGVRSKLVFNYKLPSNLRLDLDYTRYERGQQAIRYNFIDERKAALSMPLRAKKVNGLTRLSVNQFTVPAGFANGFKEVLRYTNSEFLVSGSYKGVGANLTTNAIFSNNQDARIYSNLAMTLRLPKALLLRPQVQYNYYSGQVGMVRAEMEKYLSHKGFFNVFYERNFMMKLISVGVGFRYSFSFAQASFATRKSGKVVTLTQTASGSLLYNQKERRASLSNMPQAGRGAVSVVPFLDLNCNGRKDAGEPKFSGLKLAINGGRIVHHKVDTTIFILGLEAFNDYYLELDKNSFENIAWQLRKSVIRITAEPNHFKTVEVPIAVAGEVSGKVSIQDGESLQGMGRIVVKLYDSNGTMVAKTLTESDGYFSYLGLAPGNYAARVDAAQLVNIKMVAAVPALHFIIKQNIDGDVVDGLELVLQKEQ